MSAMPGSTSTPSRNRRVQPQVISSMNDVCPRRVAGKGICDGGACDHGAEVHGCGDRRSVAVQQPGGIDGRQVHAPHRADELLCAVPAGRQRGVEKSSGGVGDRFAHRDPTVDQVTEGLGHEVHVAGPVQRTGVIVDEAAEVIGEPARCADVVQTGPHVHPDLGGAAQHLAVVLDRRSIV